MTYTFVRVASCTTSPKTYIHRYGWVRVRLKAESFMKRQYQEIDEIHGVQYDKKPGVEDQNRRAFIGTWRELTRSTSYL